MLRIFKNLKTRKQCPVPIQHKLPEKEALHLLDCSDCHQNPHAAQIALFTGQGGYHAYSLPSPKFSHSITCKGCHVLHEEVDQVRTGSGCDV